MSIQYRHFINETQFSHWIIRGFALLIALGLPFAAGAATLTVLNNGDAGADSLRDRIGAAVGGDTIEFAGGVTGVITLSSEIVINKNLVINGPGVEVLAISGGGTNRVFNITSGPVVIDNLTIRDGYHRGGDGGDARGGGGGGGA
ncbi:MAG: hypothetical protein KC964_16695, partial [Candidatus Omnitrophica bacterium]|nr:hypothetical protein [Candidatus Omnitrophota bacterium]